MRIKQWMSLLAAAAAAVLALAAAPARAAENFPVKPIQLVIPFAPGDTDNMLRPFVEKMAEFLGQPVVLNFKPGAGGGVGAGFVATSKPDGYTLVGQLAGLARRGCRSPTRTSGTRRSPSRRSPPFPKAG